MTRSPPRLPVLFIQGASERNPATGLGLEQQGYDVEFVGSAADARKLASSKSYDAIVLDGILPDCDGVALCRELRRNKVSLPILMVSALDTTADKIAGLDAGADDYLVAPFATEELMARLRSLLRRSRAMQSEELRLGDLTMNLIERQVSVGGCNIKLSAKEFALLLYMARNPRKLLTRSMISESVWDRTYEPFSNVIDVYVSSLRHKIERDPAHRRIKTVVGCGYRFLDQPEEDDSDPKA